MGQAGICRHPARDRASLAAGANEGEASAATLTEQIRGLRAVAPGATCPGSTRWTKAWRSSRRRSISPGRVRGAPKFPRPSELLFLLRETARTGDTRRRSWCENADGDVARGNARPHRRRIPPILGRCELARPAFREDALRPGADSSSPSLETYQVAGDPFSQRSRRIPSSTSCAK